MRCVSPFGSIHLHKKLQYFMSLGVGMAFGDGVRRIKMSQAKLELLRWEGRDRDSGNSHLG